MKRSKAGEPFDRSDVDCLAMEALYSAVPVRSQTYSCGQEIPYRHSANLGGYIPNPY